MGSFLKSTYSSGPIDQSNTPEILSDWVADVLEKGSLEASRRGAPTLVVNERIVRRDEIPLWMVDSAHNDDLHLYAEPGRLFFGLGAAMAWESSSPRGPASLSRRIRAALSESSSLSQVWSLGGWSFPSSTMNLDAEHDEFWGRFPGSRWVVPALLFRSAGEASTLTVSAYFSPKSSNLEASRRYYQDLLSAIQPTAKTGSRPGPRLVSSTDIPGRDEWCESARSAIEAIERGDLKKVVVSRAIRLDFAEDVPCSALIVRLLESNPDSTVFALRRGDVTFVGATPESLLSLRGTTIRVDCLAASAPRSPDVTVDRALGQRLLGDPKSRHEHGLVVKAVRRSLSRYCTGVSLPQVPLVKKLGTVQHLHTPIRAKIAPGVDLWSIALSLWPTPATGGVPKARAIRWIREREPVSRGWFSGVVGCVNGEASDGGLAVSIRSGAIRGASAMIYAGAGLVHGSVPDREFEETGWKMGPMLDALSVCDRAHAE